VGHRVVSEEDLRATRRHGEQDVGASGYAVLAVVLGPVLVVRHLDLVVVGGELRGGERVDAIAVRVLQPGAQAPGLPVAGAAQFALETAGQRGDDRVLIVGHPVGFVGVVKFDIGGGAQWKADVGAVRGGVFTIIFIPAVIDGCLVFPTARRDRKDSLPDLVVGVEACAGVADLVTSSAWWPGPSVEVRVARSDARSSTAGAIGTRARSVVIRLAAAQCTVATVAHELAHALAGIY